MFAAPPHAPAAEARLVVLLNRLKEPASNAGGVHVTLKLHVLPEAVAIAWALSCRTFALRAGGIPSAVEGRAHAVDFAP